VTTTPAIGPQLGVPPSQENVPVGMLQVDPTYQRATDGPASRRIIASMIAAWDWRLCQPLVVSRRPDGRLFILDGQHRHAGAVARGDIPFLPCFLLSSLAVEQEASTFVDLNTRRQRLTQSDIFHGMLATGEETARRVHQLLEETGWQNRRHTNTASYGAGDLNCAPMLVRQVNAGKEDAVRFALVALRKGWPDKALRSSATFLKALVEVHERLADEPHHTAETIAEILAARGQDEWTQLGGRVRATNRALSIASAIGLAIARIARGEGEPVRKPFIGSGPQPAGPGTLVSPAPPPRPQPAPAFTPPPRSAFSLEGNTAWRSQCEQRRTRDNATHCKDRFCKLKGSL
jgi:hypothetical protein